MVTCLGKSYHFLWKFCHFWGSIITLGWPQFTMSNPPNKSWQGSDPPTFLAMPGFWEVLVQQPLPYSNWILQTITKHIGHITTIAITAIIIFIIIFKKFDIFPIQFQCAVVSMNFFRCSLLNCTIEPCIALHIGTAQWNQTLHSTLQFMSESTYVCIIIIGITSHHLNSKMKIML